MRRTQEERRAETTERLLQTGEALIMEQGFARVTTKMIAKQAGISWGAAQYLFGNKVGYTSQLGSRVLAKMCNGMSPDKPVPSRDVSHFVDRVWAAFSSQSYIVWIELVRASRGDPELREVVNGLQNELLATIRGLWSTTIDCRLRAEDSEFVMHHVILTLSGLASRRVFLSDPISTEQHLKLLIRMSNQVLWPGSYTNEDTRGDL